MQRNKSLKKPLSCKERVIQTIKNHNLFPDNATIIVALSGGPDSVFLLDLLATLHRDGSIKKIIVAHLDHEWRPESGNDADFCKQLAKKYNVPFEKALLSQFKPSLKWNGSQEEIGRKGRRLFLETIVDKHNADAIALAHHQDDQQETFFIRLTRGSSLTGLCGMQMKNGLYIRPLLNICKKDIVDYLHLHNIDYLVDPSNASTHYLRNRIRAWVLPALRACDDRFDKKSIDTIKSLQETEHYLSAHTEDLFNRMSMQKNETFFISIDQLLAQSSFMQYRILVHWLNKEDVPFPVTQAFLKEIIRFLGAKKNKTHTLCNNWKLAKEKNKVHIRRTQANL